MPPPTRDTGKLPPPTGEPGAGVFVILTWLLAVAGSLTLVSRYGANLPLWDDVGLVPVICGEQSVSLEWLASTHNEHRLPLSRLALAALLRLTHNDFRSGMFASVAVMGLATLAVLIAARRIRGGWRYADSALPLFLVGPSQHAVWLWCWELQFALSAGLGLVLLVVLVRPRAADGWDLEAAIVGAIALVLLPLCGANGAAATPALAVGLFVVTRQRRKKPPWIVAGLGSLIALVLAVLVLGSARQSSRGAPLPGPGSVLRTAGQFLAVGLGWPIAPAWPIAALVVVATMAAAAWPLPWSLRNYRGRRASPAGLLAFLAASLSIALAVAWGRASAGVTAGLEARYVTLSAPLLAGTYLALDRRAHRALPRFLIAVLTVFAWALLWPNASEAIARGKDNRRGADRVERDLLDRTPAYLMVRRHVPFLGPSQAQVAAMIESLHKARIGPFRRLGTNPPFDDVAIDPQSAQLLRADWNGSAIVLKRVDSAAVFQIDPPRYVAGIQVRYDQVGERSRSARFRLEWRRPGQREIPADQVISEWDRPSGSDQLATFWVADDLAEFRIRPDNQPGRFTIQSLKLLTPSAGD